MWTALRSAVKMVKAEPEQMVSMCHQLLEQPDVEAAIRVGDVYALMVEWYYSQQQMEQAYSLVEKMRARSIILSPYLDQEMVHAIYGAMGLPVAQDPAPPPAADARGSAVGVEEEVIRFDVAVRVPERVHVPDREERLREVAARLVLVEADRDRAGGGRAAPRAA